MGARWTDQVHSTEGGRLAGQPGCAEEVQRMGPLECERLLLMLRRESLISNRVASVLASKLEGARTSSKFNEPFPELVHTDNMASHSAAAVAISRAAR